MHVCACMYACMMCGVCVHVDVNVLTQYVCACVCVYMSVCLCKHLIDHTGLFTTFLQSFGYLVPSHQPSAILGVVNDSGTFPEHDRRDLPSTRLTVSFLGGQ